MSSTAVEPKPAGTVETISHPVPAPAQKTPMELMQIIIERGTDLEQLDKLMDLQERWEKSQAKKAYTVALAKFKADPPSVIKNRKADFPTKAGRTEYEYATLAHVVATVAPSLSDYGLSHSWSVEQKDGRVAVTCTLTHEQGHSETVTLAGPIDESGSKNPIQAIGSTVSYLERYTFLAITGLAASDMDSDGGGLDENEYVTADQIGELEVLLEETGANKDAFFGWLKVERFEDIKARHFPRAKAELEEKKKKQEAAQ